ncbi:MAG: carbon-nitrogen hydrolase family protein [Pseudomonadota bacterium]
MKVAALQMVSSPDVEANLDIARGLLKDAAAQGAELAVLPEYFCVLGRTDRDKLAVQEQAGSGPVQDFLAAAAREFGLWLVGGTVPVATPDPARARNTSLAYNPAGECVARYDKIHLFRFRRGDESYDEARTLERGAEPAAFAMKSRDGSTYRVGMSVCYDLRFPELYRHLQADVLLVPSAFTFTTGQAHWEILLRARAIENLAYVVAAAQGGQHENGRRTWGHSMVVDPWGEVLAQQAEGAGVVMAEVQRARLGAVREQLPALDHRVL